MTELPALPSLSLSGRSVLVTGGAGGIGAAVARLFAAAGAAVALCDRHEAATQLRELADEIQAAGTKAVPLAGNVGDRAEMFAMALNAADRVGEIGILVACAGVYPSAARVVDIDEPSWDIVHGVNLKGVLFASQAVLPAMVARGSGSIVAIASDSAFDIIAGEACYGISKMSCVRLTAYLADELSGSGVRANAIAPGYVRTAMTEAIWADPVVHAAAIAGIPLRRFAEPLDIAHAALFLSTPLGAYVNGHCLVVDGGRIAGRPS